MTTTALIKRENVEDLNKHLEAGRSRFTMRESHRTILFFFEERRGTIIYSVNEAKRKLFKGSTEVFCPRVPKKKGDYDKGIQKHIRHKDKDPSD